MVEEEESNPTVEHPPNWSQLNGQEKADLIIKLICVSDFSLNYFKKVSSQNASIEEQQENESPQSDKEVIISIMRSINLDDVEHIDANTSNN